MADEKQYVTKEKLEELKVELEELKTVRRREVAEDLEYARSLGDLSENAEYQEARDQQGKIEDRIAQVEYILKHAVVVAPHHSDKAEVGSTVVVRKKGDKEDKTFIIVGPEEVGPGRISYQSPLGMGVIGKKKGDEFSFSTPAGEAKYTVVEIK